MISNEERREVAAWLRLSGDSLALDNCFVRFLRDTAGSDLPTEDFNAASYLAELIERPTTKRDDVGGTHWRCEQCGAFNRKDAVTDLFSVIPSRHCANCGADVVSDED